VRLCIVDDHEIVREGLRRVLVDDPELDIDVVGEAGSGAAALDGLRAWAPDVILVDYRLPDTTGDVLCERIRLQSPSTAVVVLTTYLSEDVVQRCLDAGAVGFVTKASGLDELRAVLRAVAVGEAPPRPSSSAVVRRAAQAEGDSGIARSITPQQERVLELVATGCTYSEIGKRLHVSESTVRFHIQRLKEKLGARTTNELIASAIRNALIDPDVGSPRT
jgi:DNA-binding NarL/FixJ family response regulator